ncbi:MAG TPA: hypothetical protein VET25_08870 [Aestuariivirgaceae bacterium]|nr:hypothetical protein [Aestuariivirgaceae bacterium]
MRLPIILIAVLLQGCIYVPRTTNVYDEECRYELRHWTLKPEEIGSFGSCTDEGCLAMLVGTGIVAAASVVVSGSIVVVGNIVQWVEKQQCSISPRNT